jgi:hypothetical protein
MPSAPVLKFFPAGNCLTTISFLQLSTLTNCPAYDVTARNTQKTPFLAAVSSCCRVKHASLRSRYLVTAVVFLLISRSLPSNGSTCHIMHIILPWDHFRQLNLVQILMPNFSNIRLYKVRFPTQSSVQGF